MLTIRPDKVFLDFSQIFYKTSVTATETAEAVHFSGLINLPPQ